MLVSVPITTLGQCFQVRTHFTQSHGHVAVHAPLFLDKISIRPGLPQAQRASSAVGWFCRWCHGQSGIHPCEERKRADGGGPSVFLYACLGWFSHKRTFGWKGGDVQQGLKEFQEKLDRPCALDARVIKSGCETTPFAWSRSRCCNAESQEMDTCQRFGRPLSAISVLGN